MVFCAHISQNDDIKWRLLQRRLRLCFRFYLISSHVDSTQQLHYRNKIHYNCIFSE